MATTSGKSRVYLAGPTVFMHDARERFAVMTDWRVGPGQ